MWNVNLPSCRIALNQLSFGRRYIHRTKVLFTNHYETLRVKKDCSHNEIRQAYLELSKKFHPDLHKGDATKNKMFSDINEAYSILSKAHTRKEYDNALMWKERDKKYYRTEDETEADAMWRKTWGNPAFFHNRKDLNYNAKDDEYYSIKGIKRISNANLVMILISISFAAGLLQIYFIRITARMRQKKHLQESQQLAKDMEIMQGKSRSLSWEEYDEQLKKSYDDNLLKMGVKK